MDTLLGVCSLAIVVFLSLSEGTAGPEVRSHTRVVLLIDVAPMEGYVRAMIAEADAIWRPHGVSVAVSAGDDIGPGDVVLALHVARDPEAAIVGHRSGSHATDTGGRLGGLRFSENGAPAPAVIVDASAVRALLVQASAGLWGITPLTMGRAMGRVLAHEIGHFLLAFPAHAQRGLMRASFDGRELSEFNRRKFELGPALLPRLRARLARMTPSSR